jgi:hypothetical protein
MLMMVIAGVNAMAFHYIMLQRGLMDDARVPPVCAKLAGALGVALWGFDHCRTIDTVQLVPEYLGDDPQCSNRSSSG